MAIPDINFRNIRNHGGSKANAFEELVCQLASLESHEDSNTFVKKGLGADGGLECFAIWPDGNEIGWQAKYYWEFAAPLQSALNNSLDRALVNHPEMRKFVVAIPFDLSDPRKAERETQRDAYDAWTAERIARAATEGRTLNIDLWDANRLRTMLSRDHPAYAGRTLFWFDVERFDHDWFKTQFDRIVTSLGPRFTAQSHVDLPIRQTFMGLARQGSVRRQVLTKRANLRDILSKVTTDPRLFDAERSVLNKLRETIIAFDPLPDGNWPTASFLEQLCAVREVIIKLQKENWQRRREEEKPDADWVTLHDLEIADHASLTLVELLESDPFCAASQNSLLLLGEAGNGKSHLMADVARQMLVKGIPALLIPNSQLGPGEPWQMIAKELDLPPHYGRTSLLGALDAAAQAHSGRMLVMVDALNERDGRKIWPDRLATFRKDAEAFPHLAVAVSCRTSFLDAIVPDDVRTSIFTVHHTGFSSEDAQAYLKGRGIVLPGHPFLDAELTNPLFLKVCCDALERDGLTRFPKGLRGVTDVFGMFHGSVVRTLNQRLNLNPKRRYVERVIEIIAQEMERCGEEYVEFDQAVSLVDSIYSSSGQADDDLLYQLEVEGVFASETSGHEDGPQTEIRFSFQKFSEHTIAQAILDAALTENLMLGPLPADNRLERALQDRNTSWGLKEALALQFAERCGVELGDALPALSASFLVSFDTLRMRSPKTVTRRTLELVMKHQSSADDAWWEALLIVATDPENEFSAGFLHDELSKLSMVERDATWSTYLVEETCMGGSQLPSPCLRIIDWATNRHAAASEDDVATCAAIVLTWAFTTSSRTIRDRATNALVSILATRPDTALQLLSMFEGVDDPYVGERLSAAIYGAALGGGWTPQKLQEVAETSAEMLLSDNVPKDMLWRDHIRRLIEFTEHSGIDFETESYTKLRPPFSSAWPLCHVTDETINGYMHTRHKYTGPDDIVSSTGDNGDFGCYVINYAVNKWSITPRGVSLRLTDQDVYRAWFDDFKAYATSTMREAYDALLELRKGDRLTFATTNSKHPFRVAEASFAELLGETRYEDYRIKGRYGPYDDERSASSVAEINIPWARRWVCMRAHELGWDERLHGPFDKYCNSDRMSHQVERIGKKYQWIALRELLSHISDNCEPTRGAWTESYTETIRRLRDTDPSLLITMTSDTGWSSFDEATFWMPGIPLERHRNLDQVWDWYDTNEDRFDSVEQIALGPDQAGKLWLPLGSFRHFTREGDTDETKGLVYRANIWTDCIVVRAADLTTAIEHLNKRVLIGEHDVMAQLDGVSDVFLGEHGWRNSNLVEWTTDWGGSRWNAQAAVEARATAIQFDWENEYDQSLDGTVRVRLPAPWLMEVMSMKLSDGRAVKYVGADGDVLFQDPTADHTGCSAALIDRYAFVESCNEHDLSPIWIVGVTRELDAEEPHVFGRQRSTYVFTLDEGDAVVRRLDCSEQQDQRSGNVAGRDRDAFGE